MTINGGPGNDSLDGTPGNDTIDGMAGNDTLNGLAGDDCLIGGPGNDVLNGGPGNDTLKPGAGATSLSGGGGIDTFETEDGAGSIFVDLVGGFASGAGITATLIQVQNLDLGSGNDTAMGDGADNRIDGGAGNDVLTGLAGNDVLIGGLGNDALDGGIGNDVLIPGDGTDTVTLGAGNNTLDLSQGGQDILINSPAQTFVDDFGSVNVITDPLNLTTVIGGDGDDTIALDGGVNLIIGAGGNDSLLGRDGNDILEGGAGSDILSGGSGIDDLLGQSGNDQILGGDGNDFIDAGDGDDSATGDAGNDEMTGGCGNDVLFGGDGIDIINGGDGNDSVDGNEDDDVIDGGDGDDFLIGNQADDTLRGGAGDDRLEGSFADDHLEGGTGNNSIAGGDGIDTLTYINSATAILFGADRIVQHDGNQQDTVSSSVEKTWGSSFGDTFVGAATDDRFFGAAGNDAFSDSGSGNNRFDGGSGFDTVTFDRDDPLGLDVRPNGTVYFSNLTTLATDTVRGVEQIDTAQGQILPPPVLSADGGADFFTLEGTTLTLNWELSAASVVPVTFNVFTSARGATAGVDYTPITIGFFTIQPGEQTAAIQLDWTDDQAIEANETLVVTVFNLTGGAVLPGNADSTSVTVTGFDDDTPDVANDTTTGAAATPDSTQQGVINTAGDVDIFTFTATAGESFVISADGLFGGDGTGLNPRLRILDSAGNELASDDDSGPGNNALLSFTPPAPGTFFVEVGAAAADTGGYSVDLFRNTTLPQVSISDGVGFESQIAGVQADFIVSLDRASDQDVTVTVFTPGVGSATLGSDYVGVEEVVTIPAGTLQVTVPVLIPNDTIVEDDETFIVQLRDPGNATIRDAFGQGKIRDIGFDGPLDPLNLPGNTTISFADESNDFFVIGGAGNDDMATIQPPTFVPNVTLIGGDGRDHLKGGNGNDLLIVTDFDEIVLAPPPPGHGPQLDELTPPGEVVEGGGGADTAIGGPNDDSIFGEAGGDFLIGAGGDDLLIGGDGDDVGFAGSGEDMVVGNVGNDFLFADLNPATAASSRANMDAGPGNDRIHFNATDVIAGGGAGIFDVALPVNVPAGFTIDLGAAANQNGGASGVALLGFEAVDASLAASGISVVGAAFDIDFGDGGGGLITVGNVLFGGLFADTFVGSDAADIVLGNQGADSIAGGAGNDTVIADAGNDTVAGGAGADDIFYPDVPAAGAVVVTDFTAVDDTLLLSASFGLSPQQALAQLQQAGADAVLTLPGSGRSITLAGVQAASLTALDFETV